MLQMPAWASICPCAADEPRAVMAWEGKLKVQPFPVILFANGHVAFVQRLPWRCEAQGAMLTASGAPPCMHGRAALHVKQRRGRLLLASNLCCMHRPCSHPCAPRPHPTLALRHGVVPIAIHTTFQRSGVLGKVRRVCLKQRPQPRAPPCKLYPANAASTQRCRHAAPQRRRLSFRPSAQLSEPPFSARQVARLREFGLWLRDTPQYYGAAPLYGSPPVKFLAYENDVLAFVAEQVSGWHAGAPGSAAAAVGARRRHCRLWLDFRCRCRCYPGPPPPPPCLRSERAGGGAVRHARVFVTIDNMFNTNYQAGSVNHWFD